MALKDENLAFVAPVGEDEIYDFINNIDRVCVWGAERNITAEGGATALSQCKKMAEELQEFIDAKTPEEAQDAVGDMLVVLIQIARLRGIYLSDALEGAWNEIKDRKGKMVDGVFVKEV